MKILVTGGAGYLGSNICSALTDHGYTAIILDSLIGGQRAFTKNRQFYLGDIADSQLLTTIFQEHPQITTTIHCAALTSVPESVLHPYSYYLNNVAKPLVMLKKLSDLGCKNLIFSSSAAVYADNVSKAIAETAVLSPKSPYAAAKVKFEAIIREFCQTYDIKSIILRYFNPIGTDPQFRSGYYPKAHPSLLEKLILAAKNESSIEIAGAKWPTKDGTCIRDYLHTWDLALAHVAAVKYFAAPSKNSCEIINLGSGQGLTVKEFINIFQNTTGCELLVKESAPRSGDVAGGYADITKAKQLLGWQPIYDIPKAILTGTQWHDHCQNGLASF